MLNTANALVSYRGALNVSSGGTLKVENCDFHDNQIAIVAKKNNEDDFQVRINRSKFQNNVLYDVISQDDEIDLRYNWWGSENGPEKTSDSNGNTVYPKIVGQADFSDWREKEEFHDPVIIVPGILVV